MLWRRVLLALAANDHEAARTHALAMEQALRRRTGSFPSIGSWRISISRASGANSVSPDRTFAHWTAGTACSAASSRSRATRIAPSSTRRSQSFDRARLHDGPRAQNRDPAPVFIVGMPRSGTTLAEQIIAAHPQAFGAGERGALAQAFAALGGDTPEGVARIAALDAPALDAAAAALSRRTARARPGQGAHRRQDAGQFQFSRSRGAHAAGRAHHPLRARPARHRAVDLHLPLLRLSSLRARSRRSRLVHRPARPPDGALA